MIGKDKCKMLKEIRREIARENDIQMVIEDCTYQGRCKGTCPKCEAEVAYLEEQLEKRKNLGKAVCVAGISAAMFTTTLQASTVQAYGKTQTSYSQGVTSDTEDPYEGRYAGAMVITETPEPPLEGVMRPETPSPEPTPNMPEGTMAPTMPPTKTPFPEGTMAPTMPPETEEPMETVTPGAVTSGTATPTVTPSVKPKAVRIAFISKIENNRIYIKNGNDNLAGLVNDFYLQLTEDAQITKMVDGDEQVITIDQLQPDDKIQFVFSGLIVKTSPDGFLEACEKVTVLEPVTPTESATPMETPTAGVITLPPESQAPTETPAITAVPTPTDEYLVYTQSPVPQNTVTPETATNAPGNTVTPGTATNILENTVTPGTSTNAPENTVTPGTATNIPDNPAEKKKCVVTYYDENRETIFEIQEIEPGATLQNMPTPVREGYLFDGWYVMGQDVKVSADTKVSGDMSIVAHWKKVTVNETNLRTVKSLADGTLYIKWGKVKNAEGYKIILASNSKLSKGRKSVTVGSKKTSVKLKGLRDGKKYYVAVYAYKKDSEKNKIYGTCKKSKSVTIKVK